MNDGPTRLLIFEGDPAAAASVINQAWSAARIAGKPNRNAVDDSIADVVRWAEDAAGIDAADAPVESLVRDPDGDAEIENASDALLWVADVCEALELSHAQKRDGASDHAASLSCEIRRSAVSEVRSVVQQMIRDRQRAKSDSAD